MGIWKEQLGSKMAFVPCAPTSHILELSSPFLCLLAKALLPVPGTVLTELISLLTCIWCQDVRFKR